MKSKYVKKHECVIIGGGAAGMMAAVQLAGYGIDNCIIEQERLEARYYRQAMASVILLILI